MSIKQKWKQSEPTVSVLTNALAAFIITFCVLSMLAYVLIMAPYYTAKAGNDIVDSYVEASSKPIEERGGVHQEQVNATERVEVTHQDFIEHVEEHEPELIDDDARVEAMRQEALRRQACRATNKCD